MLPYDEYIKELQKFPTTFRTGIELYRDSEGRVETLIEKRGEDDKYFGGRWALFGSTVFMRETKEEFWKRFAVQETGIEIQDTNPSWNFCGILETPHTNRHHGMIQVFGRIWNERPKNTQGEWYALSDLPKLPMVLSERAVLNVALNVLLEGKVPYYAEFFGTDTEGLCPLD